MEKLVLICIDRDGTIVHDNNWLGSNLPNKKIELKEGVVTGLKLLHKINARTVLISNQLGPSRGKVKSEHINAVNNHIQQLLQERGVPFHAMFYCDKVPSWYASKHGISQNNPFVFDNDFFKPNIGMLREAAKLFNLQLEDIRHKYMIGDRIEDVLTGLNAKGKSVFIQSEADRSSTKEIEELQKLSENKGRIYIAKDFLDAAEWIVGDLGI